MSSDLMQQPNRQLTDVDFIINESDIRGLGGTERLRAIQGASIKAIEIEREAQRQYRELIASVNRGIGSSAYSAIQNSKRDTLTNLPNRAHFQNELYLLNQRAPDISHGTAMVMVDIDHFKSVNDTYGHKIGDEVLKQVSETIYQESIEHDFYCSRWGGEEFALIILDRPLTNAYKIAEELRQQISRATMQIPGDRPEFVTTTVSIGIDYVSKDDIHSGHLRPEIMIDRADGALYQAKRLGRDKVIMHTPQR